MVTSLMKYWDRYFMFKIAHQQKCEKDFRRRNPFFHRQVDLSSPLNYSQFFLSNALDLLQSLELLEILANIVVHDFFLLANKLIYTIQKYDLWKGEAEIGGHFPRFLLQNGNTYIALYDSIKILGIVEF